MNFTAILLDTVAADAITGAAHALKRHCESSFQRCDLISVAAQVQGEIAQISGPAYVISTPDSLDALAHHQRKEVAAALNGWPVALVIAQSLDAPRSPHQSLGWLADGGAICLPEVTFVHSSESDPLRLSPDSFKATRSLHRQFSVFSAAMALYGKLSGQNEEEKKHGVKEYCINHLNIMSSNLSRSLDFYEQNFGARLLYNLGPKKIVTEINGFEFFIEETDVVSYPAGFHFGIRATAEKVAQLYQTLSGKGVTFVNGNNHVPGLQTGVDGVRTAFYLEDPDGLLIEVYSPELALIEQSAALLASAN